MSEQVLVDYRYLMKKIGRGRSVVREILNKDAKRINKGGQGIVALYDRDQIDAIAARVLEMQDAPKADEWTLRDIADHFGIHVKTANKVVNREGFPIVKRQYSLARGRNAGIWDANEIKQVVISDYLCRTGVHKQYKAKQPEPFSWSGIQAEFIRLCRPGGLLANNGDFA